MAAIDNMMPGDPENIAYVLDDYLVGRRDVFVEQQENGSYSVVRRELSTLDLKDHTSGKRTLGTYTSTADGKVRCVTWDVDSGKLSDVYAIVAQLSMPYVVCTSGRKGWHIIQSFEPRLKIVEAYDYGQAVKKLAGVDCESFPKQSEIKEGEYGNLTKLPLGIHRVTGNRSQKIVGGFGYADRADIPRICENSLRVREEKPSRRMPVGVGESTWLGQMFNGDYGDGRNNTLNRFVYWLTAREFPPELIEQCVGYVNDECFDEPLDEGEVELILRPRSVT